MKKIWMNTKDALRPVDKKHTPRHATAQDREFDHVHNAPYDRAMSDRFRPSLSTR